VLRSEPKSQDERGRNRTQTVGEFGGWKLKREVRDEPVGRAYTISKNKRTGRLGVKNRQ